MQVGTVYSVSGATQCFPHAETWEGAFCLQADEQTKEQSAVCIEVHVTYSLLYRVVLLVVSLYVSRKERDDMRAAAR
jgi:hypothetical protein